MYNFKRQYFLLDNFEVTLVVVSRMSFDSSNLATMMLSVKKDLALVSAVVAVDYMTRVTTDLIPDELKNNYVDPIFDYASSMINDLGVCMIDGSNVLMSYFNTGNFNQEA